MGRSATGRAAVSCALFTALAACGGLVAPGQGATSSDDGGATASDGADVDPVGAFIDAYCAFFRSCSCTSTPCPTQMFDARNKGGFSPESAQRCLDDLRVESENPQFCALGPSTIACSSVFKTTGPRKPGENCIDPPNVAGIDIRHGCENEGVADGTCYQGRCLALSRGKEGDPCIASRTIVLDRVPDRRGLYETMLIIANATTGAVCFQADGLYCDERTFHCTWLGENGDACRSLGDPSAVSGSTCVANSWCHRSICEPRLPVGASCSELIDGAENREGCTLDAYCPSFGSNQHCEKRQPVGAACGGSETILCSVGAYCDDNECKPSSCFDDIAP